MIWYNINIDVFFLFLDPKPKAKQEFSRQKQQDLELQENFRTFAQELKSSVPDAVLFLPGLHIFMH